MNINASPGMGLFSVIQVLTIVLGIAKELLTIFLLFKGIQVASIYIKNNRNE